MRLPHSIRQARGHPWVVCAMAFGFAAFPAAVPAQSGTNDQSSVAQTAEPTPPPVGLLAEPRFIGRAIDFATRTVGDGTDLKSGFYPELSNMITGSGWISAGPGYRQWMFGDRAVVDASAAFSWRSYRMAQARFELTNLVRSRLAVGSQVRWQDLTQITFFGEGADTPETDRSEYRLKSTNLVGYSTIRPARWLSVVGRVGWLHQPTLLPASGRFQRGNPDTQEVFPENVVFALTDQPNYLHGDVSVIADTRDYRSHPSKGGLYRAAWAAYSDRDAAMFSFNRYEAEAAQFVQLADARVVVALHGWLVGSETSNEQSVPFYLEPGLGGHNTLRAYTDYRFHDRNLVVVNAESRVTLSTHLDAAVFVDAGNVASRIADLDLAKRAYGVGVRLHSQRVTFARFDVAHGAEGWRFFFRMNDPLHLSRLSRRMATVPFVP